MRVLFDTNIVAYWSAGKEGFAPVIRAHLRKIRKRNATFYISSVTVQEMLVFSGAARYQEQTNAFFAAESLTVLPFDEPAAKRAARICHSIAPERLKSAERSGWHRDLAILGTAVAADMDQLVTANGKDFEKFVDSVSVEIVTLQEMKKRGR